MGMTVDGSPPRHGHYTTPPYLSGNHTPPPAHPGMPHQFPFQGEGPLSVYTNLGKEQKRWFLEKLKETNATNKMCEVWLLFITRIEI